MAAVTIHSVYVPINITKNNKLCFVYIIYVSNFISIR